MASLRKIKGKYYAYFHDPARTPKRKSYPLRVSRKDAAETWLRRLEMEWAEGLFDPWNPSGSPDRAMPFVDAHAAFLDAKRELRPKSRTAYDTALKGLGASLPAGIAIGDLAPEHVRPYIEDTGTARKPISAETRFHRHRHLRAFFNWCRERGMINGDPLRGVRLPKKRKKVTEFLRAEDVERLLVAIDEHEKGRGKRPGRKGRDSRWLKDVILVAVGTGLRRGELCAMRWDWLDFSTGFLTVRVSDRPGGFQTKSGAERAVPLAGEARAVLQRLRDEAKDAGRYDPSGYVFQTPDGGPLNGDYVGKRFRYFADMAGLKEGIRFHSLRHTTASWLTMKGVPLAVTQAVLGHSSGAVTERYAHLAPDVMQAAMNQTFGPGAVKESMEATAP